MRDAHRVGAAAHQLLRQRKRLLVRAVEAEGAGVGQDGGVETRRDLGRNLHPRLARQAEDHLRRRAGVRVDPVHVREGTRCRVMVDVDEVVLLQAGEARARHAVAFQDDRGLRIRRFRRVSQHRVGEGQRSVDGGHTVAQHHAGLLAHAAENLRARESGADGITVRSRVRGENELLSSPNLV